MYWNVILKRKRTEKLIPKRGKYDYEIINKRTAR